MMVIFILYTGIFVTFITSLYITQYWFKTSFLHSQGFKTSIESGHFFCGLPWCVFPYGFHFKTAFMLKIIFIFFQLCNDINIFKIGFVAVIIYHSWGVNFVFCINVLTLKWDLLMMIFFLGSSKYDILWKCDHTRVSMWRYTELLFFYSFAICTKHHLYNHSFIWLLQSHICCYYSSNIYIV